VVYDLAVEGEGKPVGVTGTHPFWSEDRRAWMPAKDLRVGERLRGLGGASGVRALALRGRPEPVYNIEVEGDHCYRVGQQGLLVHNASGMCDHRKTYQATWGKLYKGKVGTSVSVQVTKRMLVSGWHSDSKKPDWWDPDYSNYRFRAYLGEHSRRTG
jgi:hypothetical protein